SNIVPPVDGTGRLAGRRILVVGGGQQDYGVEDPPVGNGRAMSILFAREGAAVAAADIDEEAARATAEAAGAVAIHADASDEDSVVSMLSRAREDLGGLDGLVLNVGIARGFALAKTSVEEWDEVLAV